MIIPVTNLVVIATDQFRAAEAVGIAGSCQPDQFNIKVGPCHVMRHIGFYLCVSGPPETGAYGNEILLFHHTIMS